MLTRLAASAALAATLAGAALLPLMPTTADAVPAGTAFKPGQAFTADFGSKHLVGYFVTDGKACDLTLMIAERLDPDYAQGTGARLQLAVAPGQGALLGSGEGTSVSVTCASDAARVSLLTQTDGV